MIRMLLFFFLAICTSCNQKNQGESAPVVIQQQPIIKDNFKTAEVIAAVPLSAESSQAFALYLPKGYSDSVKFPVIIFFDPHGDGTVPLNLYRDLADKYGYVLIGSNTSKNGLDFNLIGTIANNLISEARNRFSIDDRRIALCGFSGGAKVALLAGASNPYIARIIYAGAKVDIQPNHPVELLGFAGTHDMNYTDLVSFYRLMEKMQGHPKHFLIEWGGKHEFPSAEVFNDAFIFLNTGRVENYEKKMATITEAKVTEEQAYKQKYIKAFQGSDMDWWKKEIAMLNSKKKSDVMYERLLGFLSLACYSIGGGQLKQNNLQAAEKILNIYKLADPGNKDCEAMMAELNSKKAGKQ